MPSKQSEAVRRRWEAARLAMVQPDGEGPDDESWGDLTAEPRGVDYLETEAGSRPAMWAVPKSASADRVLLCIHGGGFVSGSIYTHRKMFGHGITRITVFAEGPGLVATFGFPPTHPGRGH